MGGFFGTISTKDCVNDLFYGTDYHSHLGTKRAGLVTFDSERGFSRAIHSLERDYFRSKFEDELNEFAGTEGIGVISDTDPQPIIVNSHLGDMPWLRWLRLTTSARLPTSCLLCACISVR